MAMITLEQLYFIVQIGAGIAVVVSLVYVGLQLKQNTQAIRLATVEHVIQQLREHEALVCQCGELAEIFWRGMREPETLEGPDRLRFYQSCNYYYKTFENAYIHYRDGLLGAEVFDSIKRFFVDICSLPGMRAYWADRSHWTSHDFQQFVAREIFADGKKSSYRLAGQGEPSPSRTC